jgi:hypothetical protein
LGLSEVEDTQLLCFTNRELRIYIPVKYSDMDIRDEFSSFVYLALLMNTETPNVDSHI